MHIESRYRGTNWRCCFSSYQQRTCSDKQQASHLRRTIYFEFRSLSHLRSNSRFSDNWLEKRQLLFEQLKVKPLKKIDTEIIVLPVGFYDEQVKIEAAEYSFAF